MGDIGTPELLIIIVVVVVLFGAKKLPDAARSLGRSLRIFKSEIKGLHDDDHPAAVATAPGAPVNPAVVHPAAPTVTAPAPAVDTAPPVPAAPGAAAPVTGPASTADSAADGRPTGSR
ncbi:MULTISPECIES: Sec-independent protein translocase subunit TatA [Frankia]|uniref:Sec-independent protein translocase subunit TatA n=1 Tax=Frankia TaxID=1854 RepID=UPI0002FDC11B|nr:MULTISPECIES: Sec-independent protein translocase subunit TatA [unclassified Frankia]